MTREEVVRNLGARLGEQVSVVFEVSGQPHICIAKLIGVTLQGIQLEGLCWLYFEGSIKIRSVSIEEEIIYEAP